MVEKLPGMLEGYHRKYVGLGKKIHTNFGQKPPADFRCREKLSVRWGATGFGCKNGRGWD